MNAIQEYAHVVDAIYGVYLDISVGFFMLRDDLERRQVETIERLKETHPEYANLEHLDSAWFMYGTDPPNTPNARPLHSTTQKQYKERISPGGQNDLFIGNMTLVAIYQYWEDEYRSKIAELLKMKKNELKSPIMGDIRLLRQSIVHCGGIASSDVEKCELLPWFHKGDQIYLGFDRFKTMVGHIYEMLNGYHQQIEN